MQQNFKEDIFNMALLVIFQRYPTRSILNKDFLYLCNGYFDWYVGCIVLNQFLHVAKSRPVWVRVRRSRVVRFSSALVVCSAAPGQLYTRPLPAKTPLQFLFSSELCLIRFAGQRLFLL